MREREMWMEGEELEGFLRVSDRNGGVRIIDSPCAAFSGAEQEELELHPGSLAETLRDGGRAWDSPSMFRVTGMVTRRRWA